MRKTALLFGIVVIALLVVFSVARPAQRRVPQFDVLIRNGRIVDGSGAPWFRGDVGIVGDRITALGTIGDATAATAIDATNLVVAPGFIDLLGQSEFNILVNSRAASKILQGVMSLARHLSA
jgi:dihydroorotase/N-acyl-D-amino-acid deacylase